jgi:PHS family inorganic phosphate transporter-like MFS transporter
MLAAVFLMQPLGQLAATAVGWGVLASILPSRQLDKLPLDGTLLTASQQYNLISAIDTVWRCVIGVGAAPALIAIIYRISIPESPRYTLDVDGDGRQAVADIEEYDPDPVFSNDDPPPTQSPVVLVLEADDSQAMPSGFGGRQQDDEISSYPRGQGENVENGVSIGDNDQARKVQFTHTAIEKPTEGHTVPRPAHSSFWRFLWDEGNLRYLFATSSCWFLLDFTFCGLGINNPRVIAAIWRPSNQTAISIWPGAQMSSQIRNYQISRIHMILGQTCTTNSSTMLDNIS